jgi:hypothetical protein
LHNMNQVGIAKCVLCGRPVNKVRDTFLEIDVQDKGNFRKRHTICHDCIQRCGDLVTVVFADII